MNPLVTIITPAYNCEKYIDDTIESVLGNGYKNIEYILVDDGSIDNTVSRIFNFITDKILLIQNGINKGEQISVNKALDSVEGKYLMIVNADDPLLPGAISKLVEFMEQHLDVLCAYPDWESINEDGSHRAYIKCRDYDFEYMVNHHTCLPSVGSMFRSSVLKTIRRDTSYRWLGDFDFWFKVGFLGPMAHVPQTLATWRHRDGQASGDKSDLRAREHIRIAKDFGAEARCWSYIVAAAVTEYKKNVILYLMIAFLHHPQIVLKIDFWDTLIKRAYYILRR